MSTEQLVVAATQMSSTADIKHNLTLAEGLIDQAAKNGAQLVLLPENFRTHAQHQYRAAAGM